MDVIITACSSEDSEFVLPLLGSQTYSNKALWSLRNTWMSAGKWGKKYIFSSWHFHLRSSRIITMHRYIQTDSPDAARFAQEYQKYTVISIGRCWALTHASERLSWTQWCAGGCRLRTLSPLSGWSETSGARLRKNSSEENCKMHCLKLFRYNLSPFLSVL